MSGITPQTPCKSLLFIPGKMRATWKAALPALLLWVQRHKGTENREAAAPPEIPQMLGPETEASDSALVSLWLPIRPALRLLNGGGGGQERQGESEGSLAGQKGFHHKASATKRNSGQMGKFYSHLTSERQKEMQSFLKSLSKEGRGEKLPKKKKRKKNLFIIKTTFCSNFLDSWG